MSRLATLLTGLALCAACSSCRPRAGNPPASVDGTETGPDAPLFVEATDDAGLEFVHTAGDLQRYFFPSIMGGGCAFLDFDRDGLLDIFLVNGNSGPGSPSDNTAATNRLFRQTEDGRLEDVTAAAGLGDAGYGMGVAVGDVNNDGYPDLYVTNYGPDRLYVNLRDGTFRDVTDSAGISNPFWSASASFLDYDRDGWLDLYVANYVDYYPERHCPDADGREDFCGPQVFFNTADRLFHNVSGAAADAGDPAGVSGVRFEDVSVTSGIAGQKGPGLGVVCADLNGDRWCDIYVANDRTANFLWINQRDGTFVEQAVLRGAAYDLQGRPQAGMGIGLGDVNGDAALDLYVTHFEGETNALYLSAGGQFAERSAGADLLTATFPFTGFGTALVDLNHDARLDIVVANGRVKRPGGAPRGQLLDWSEYAEANQIFLGAPDGKFREVKCGDPFSTGREVSRGLATGDFDRDGDVDVLVVNTAGPARLFRNESPKAGGWFRVRAVDPQRGGRDAYGAVVTVVAGPRRWTQVIQPGSSYLSSSEPVAHFGTSGEQRVDQVRIDWPDGASEVFDGGEVNQTRVVERGAGRVIDEQPAR